MTWHVQPTREAMIALTSENPFERFADGRPKVPDDLIERMKLVTTEEAWGTLRRHRSLRTAPPGLPQSHPGLRHRRRPWQNRWAELVDYRATRAQRRDGL